MSTFTLTRREFQSRPTPAINLPTSVQPFMIKVRAGTAPGKEKEKTGETRRKASGLVVEAFKRIEVYIPSELIGLYIIILSQLQDNAAKIGVALVPMGVFLGFVIGSIPFTWLVYAAQRRESGGSWPFAPREWPWWPMVTTPIAFVAWSSAMPGSAFAHYAWYDAGWSGAILFLTVTVLVLLDRAVKGKQASD